MAQTDNLFVLIWVRVGATWVCRLVFLQSQMSVAEIQRINKISANCQVLQLQNKSIMELRQKLFCSPNI